MNGKTAIVHDWLTGMRGGEHCLKSLLKIIDRPDIFTLLHRPAPGRAGCQAIDPEINRCRITTSFLQHLPGISRWYRYALPLFPLAISGFNLSAYDLIISISHCAAKGICKPPGRRHICYCLTPMRYAYDHYDTYFPAGTFTRRITDRIMPRLAAWDKATATGVDEFIAISHFIRERIERIYHRSAAVIYPPVRTDYFTPDPSIAKNDYYVLVSALEPYKGIDLALAAFRRCPRRNLVIIGSGSRLDTYRRQAPANVSFLGRRPDSEVRDHMRRARGFIFPSIEDFGIAPVEAMACGTPALALDAGAARETVTDGINGLFFSVSRPVDSLLDGLDQFEKINWKPEAVSNAAARFSESRFLREMNEVITSRP